MTVPAEGHRFGVVMHPLAVGGASAPHVIDIQDGLDPGVHRLAIACGLAPDRVVSAVRKPRRDGLCRQQTIATDAVDERHRAAKSSLVSDVDAGVAAVVEAGPAATVTHPGDGEVALVGGGVGGADLVAAL
ncbi:MAG: hypothetical protein ACLPXZ_13865 [Mycobacterium sp.]